MSINTNPTQKSPERAFSLQKYLLLHSQQAALQKEIQSILTTYSSNSPSISSTMESSSASLPGSRRRSVSVTTSTPPPPPNPYTHSHLRSRRHSKSQGRGYTRPTSSLDSLSELSSSSSSSLSSSSSTSNISINDDSNEKHPLSPTPPSTPPTLTSFPSFSSDSQLHLQKSKKLQETNLQIKDTLTDLLNSESVSCDQRYSAWVKSRLVDIERELLVGL